MTHVSLTPLSGRGRTGGGGGICPVAPAAHVSYEDAQTEDQKGHLQGEEQNHDEVHQHPESSVPEMIKALSYGSSDQYDLYRVSVTGNIRLLFTIITS